ncbi:CHAT domain-containing protein [Streptomyces atratus]|uniref:CHAT domain-containing protein n=1 Tax=Streptomyces atratus TaxID=1893 RepID=UPI00224CF368|nr:CHAT domain-containing protein [Streptomyces atratus]MCX5341903.1 CHAT domain-containing protein [Streptomyces atratus]
MRDALLRELADRVRDFGNSGAPDVVLDGAGGKAAAELMAGAGEALDLRGAVDTDVLHTVAAYYWARSLAHGDATLSDADHMRAMHVFGLLYLVDHRRVPRELWSQLTEETGHDPWQDPVDHASDLVLDAEEGGDPSLLDDAIALLQGSPAGSYRDTTFGLALRHRAAVADRPLAGRLADADSAVELLARVAAVPEESPALRARRQVTLADAHIQRFGLSADHADLTAAESAARTAFTEAPEDSAGQADAAASIGVSLGRRAEEKPLPDAVALLREAVSWLRLAVDLETAPGRESDYRTNLRKAMQLLLDCTVVGPEEEREGEVARATAPLALDSARQARALAELGSKIVARIIPETEAVRRAVDPAFALSREAVDAVVAGAMGLVSSGAPQDAVPALTLALEAASARWGTGPESPWWRAADAYVEAARLSLVGHPDGMLFRRAHDAVRTQIEVLRESDKTDELAETLFAAGLLHLSPYFGELPGMAFNSALKVWRDRQDRYRSLHPDDPAHAAGPDMPSPAEAAAAAVEYLRDAADLSSGHALGRVLKSLAEALSFLAGMREESYDREILLAARKAFDVLDPHRDPLGRLYTLRILHLCGEVGLPDGLPGLLPVPLRVVRARQGEHEASCVFAEALTLADEAHRLDLQAQLLDAADRELPDLSRDSHRRLRWAREVHCLADDRLACFPGPAPVDTVAAEVRSRAEAEGWSAAELAATFIHLASHADPAQTGETARDLIEEARRLDPELFLRHSGALHYLEAVLAHDLGIHAEREQQPEAAARDFASAAFQFGLCGQIDLALAALDSGLGCAHVCDGPSAAVAAFALAPASVFLRHGTDETVDWKLRDLYQSLTFKLTGDTVDLSVMSAVHQAAKGMDFTILAGHPGPLEFTAALDRILDRAQLGEAGLSGSLPDFELPGGAETAMLFYLGSGEAEPDSDAEAEVRNLQRVADRRISRELRTTRQPTRLPLLHLDEVQSLLPEETVLLSLFLSQVRHQDAANPVMALQGLAVTREGLSFRTTAFPSFEGGLVRMSKAGHTLNVSPAALQIAGLRREITADPLHRQVTRAAQQLLANDSRSYLAGFTDALPPWLTEGKTHLCVWPNGPLHYLPFHLLSADGRPVADDWTVTQVPNLAFLSRPARPGPRQGLAAFAYDSGGTDSLEAHTARIAASMGGADPVLGTAATPRRFLAALHSARYVHVAAHGSHNEWAPWYQCLYLAPDPENDDDGRVFAHDILRTDLRGVELVTMSACESALGRFDINDNLHGLPAAFLSAGAAAIVGCLWPVAPDVATGFFGTLYEQLAVAPDRRTAFRTAQSTTRTRHPAYRDWGAFCFIGDWRTTTDSSPGANE